MQYAIVDSSGNVTNVVEWDGKTDFPLSTGETLVQSDNVNCHIGGTYTDSTFSAPTELVSNATLVNSNTAAS